MVRSIFIKPKWLACIIIPVITTLAFASCTLSNQLPVISNLIVNTEGEIYPGDSYQIECIAQDPDGDDLNYVWTADGGTISGEGPIITWTAPNIPITCTITVNISDAKGGTDTEQLAIEISIPNHPPVILGLTSEWQRVEKASTTSITCIASDLTEDKLSYTWTTDGGTILGEGSTVTWAAPDVPGVYIINVEVSDGRGGITTRQLTVEVLTPGQFPAINNLTTDCPQVKPTGTAVIECIASDPDEDELTYIWMADNGVISGEGSIVSWVAPDEHGTYTITVTVTNSVGSEAVDIINIMVCGCKNACE